LQTACSAPAPAKRVVATGIKSNDVQLVARIIYFVKYCLNRYGTVAQLGFNSYVGVHWDQVVYATRLNAMSGIKKEPVTVS
jgi:hypothetical protein